MLQTVSTTILAPALCLTAACDREAETIAECSARFARLADEVPTPAGPVRGIYTFDLSGMNPDHVEQLRTHGLNGKRPDFVATNRDLDAVRKDFEAAPVSPRGRLLFAKSSILFRVPTGTHQSHGAAVRKGCSLIPGAKLRAVALTIE